MKKHQGLIPIGAVSEIQLVYHSKTPAAERILVNSSKAAASVLRGYYDMNTLELQEQFVVLYLNRGCKVLAVYRIATGGITSVTADPRLILAAALKLPTAQIIVSHSHPSGELAPSKADLLFTARLKEAAALFDIQLIDHIIVTTEAYLSMADEGHL